jgi:hypothetical protein
MATNSVENILAGAKKELAKANNLTQTVEGNPTGSFAPKKTPAPKVPQAHASAQGGPSYAQARKQRTTGEDIAAGLQSKADNVNRYMEATKEQ